jgi:hypothetical protein
MMTTFGFAAVAFELSAPNTTAIARRLAVILIGIVFLIGLEGAAGTKGMPRGCPGRVSSAIQSVYDAELRCKPLTYHSAKFAGKSGVCIPTAYTTPG